MLYIEKTCASHLHLIRGATPHYLFNESGEIECLEVRVSNGVGTGNHTEREPIRCKEFHDCVFLYIWSSS